jgi:hypothetical protein
VSPGRDGRPQLQHPIETERRRIIVVQAGRQPLAGSSTQVKRIVTDRRNIIVSLFVLHQHWLTQEIAERDAKRLGDLGKDVEPPNLAITALDFAQPVFRPAD